MQDAVAVAREADGKGITGHEAGLATSKKRVLFVLGSTTHRIRIRRLPTSDIANPFLFL